MGLCVQPAGPPPPCLGGRPVRPGRRSAVLPGPGGVGEGKAFPHARRWPRMVSRVIQLDSAHLPRLARLGVPHKDVTARERHLKLTINQLKCDLAGDTARYTVVERRKFVALARVAAAAEQVFAREGDTAAFQALAGELAALRRAQPRRTPGGGAEAGRGKAKAKTKTKPKTMTKAKKGRAAPGRA